jgi:outer membrane receptor protein involved in Fe transport
VRGLALLLLGGAAVASAQQSVDYASVSGRVTDPSGAVLQGAQVAVRQTETNVTTTAVTDKEGRFRFPYLKVGPHEIKVQYQGFAEAAKLLSLGVGAAYELPIQLHVAAASEDVTVTAEATVLEAARSQIASTVSQAEVENLPMNGRNFVDLALLVPGVAPTNVGGTNLYPETSAVAGPSISVGSQRNLSNNFIVDGLSANDDAAALSGIPYAVDAVAQFQVVTSGGQAELGRALGGYVNVVTKSGTNSHHGELYGYLRDEGLNAANALTGNTLPMTHANFGISQGGPIVRDKTFYFLNLEKRNLDQSGVITISDANVAIINAHLARVGYLGPPISTGVFPIEQDLLNVLAKLDHEFSPSDRFSFRYSRYGLDAVNARNVGGLNAPSASTGLDNTDQTFAVSNVAILSSRTVLESRAQFAYSDFLAPPDDPIGPAVSIAGVAAFGTSSGNPTGRLNKMYQLVNNLSHQSGAHAFRAGVDFIYNDDRVTYPRAARGSYTFSSMANFLAGVYNNLGFTQTFGTSVIDQGNANLGLYVQDEWKVSPRLTLNAGVRYDLQFLESIDTDGDNVSPRLGFVWSPTASRRTLIRGSAGLFYDRVPLRALANALLSAGNTTDIGNLEQIGVSLSPTQLGAPRFPEILDEVVPTTTRVNLTTMDRKLQNAYSTQASVEVEHQIGAHATASVGYSYLKGQALIMSINQNVPACVASGNNNGCRPNSTYANNPQYSSAATSDYHGLHVSFVLRPTRWGLYRVSYALSKSMNNVGEAFFSSPIDNFDLSKDWGRSDDDQRHRLTLNGTVQGPREGATTTWGKLTTGFELSAMLQYYSALPFNIVSGVTTVQGTAGRPIVEGEFIERNAGIGSDFFTLSMRLSRKVKLGSRVELEGIAEAFNLTNRRNDLTRNTNFGPGAYPTNPLPTFDQITAVGEARGFQFGLRLRY